MATRRQRPVSAAPDAELVQAIRDGDQGAVARLYERHVGAVRFVVRDRVRDEGLVEDVVQETFVRAVERMGKLRRPEQVRSWLLAIARNLSTDRWRLERRQVLGDDHLEDRLGLSASSEDQAATRELAEKVGEALQRLSTRDALALALTTYLDLDVAELAVALGVTPGTAKVVLHRARRRLRTTLVTDLLAADPEAACPGFRSLPAGDRSRHVAECEACVGGARSRLRDGDLPPPSAEAV